MVNSRLACLAAAVAFASGLHAADPLPLEEERLGAWHYLYPLEYYGGGDAKHGRYSICPPTAVAFGKKVAVFVPGSNLLAEFKEGRFEDLKYPEPFVPMSLSTDREGRLYCLASKSTHDRQEAGRRWFSSRSEGGWTTPVEIPFPGCDRVDFDSQNRLWALGPARATAVFSKGKWDMYAYSNDRKLEFMPVRMSENEAGNVVLFSYDNGGYFGQSSRMPGTLTYRNGKFTRQPKAGVAGLREAEEKLQAVLKDDSAFERAKGYVCRKQARNGGPRGPATVLRTEGHIFVSFANDGLAWASVADLAAQAPLTDAEWEPVNDALAPPTIDPKGDLWVGRDRPSRLVIYSKDKTREIAGPLKGGRDNTLDFDQFGRAWVSRWHGSMEGETTVANAGVLRNYTSFKEALKAEGPAFKPGYIFPGVLKAPGGEIVYVSYSPEEGVVILDAKGGHVFEAAQINPDEPKFAADAPGHGYNPFRDCVPWYDKDGRIHVKVNGLPFCHVNGKWVADPKGAVDDPMIPEKQGPRGGGPIAGPFQTRVTSADGRVFIFHGFHFFEKKEERLVQVDAGLNPLAYYPFWTGWYSSPGQTEPVIDPNGRIWISPLGPYADNKEWFALRKAP